MKAEKNREKKQVVCHVSFAFIPTNLSNSHHWNGSESVAQLSGISVVPGLPRQCNEWRCRWSKIKDYRKSRLNAPVFTLSGYTEFLNLALDNRKSLGCG